MRKVASRNEASTNDPSSERVHVHLRNAHFFASGQKAIGGGEPGFWRGRVDAVSGIMIGKLTEAGEPPVPMEATLI